MTLDALVVPHTASGSKRSVDRLHENVHLLLGTDGGGAAAGLVEALRGAEIPRAMLPDPPPVRGTAPP